MLSARSLACFAILSAACNGSGGNGGNQPGPDLAMAPADLAPFPSVCGKPGDTGNSLGVGKFCQTLDDCSGNSKAKICPIVFAPDSMAYFCTLTCTPTDGGANTCGENASCQCQGGQCACTPDRCLGSPDGGP